MGPIVHRSPVRASAGDRTRRHSSSSHSAASRSTAARDVRRRVPRRDRCPGAFRDPVAPGDLPGREAGHGSAAVDVWEADDGSVHGEVAWLDGRRDRSDARSPGRSRSITTAASRESVGRRDPVLGAVAGAASTGSGRSASTPRTRRRPRSSSVSASRCARRRIVKERLAASLGDAIEIDGTVVRAVPAAGTPARGVRRARPQLGQGRPAPRPGPGRASTGASTRSGCASLPEADALSRARWRSPASGRGRPRRS